MAAADDRAEDCLLDVRGARSVLVWNRILSCRQAVLDGEIAVDRGTNCVGSRRPGPRQSGV
jgi:hypothetical protein